MPCLHLPHPSGCKMQSIPSTVKYVYRSICASSRFGCSEYLEDVSLCQRRGTSFTHTLRCSITQTSWTNITPVLRFQSSGSQLVVVSEVRMLLIMNLTPPNPSLFTLPLLKSRQLSEPEERQVYQSHGMLSICQTSVTFTWSSKQRAGGAVSSSCFEELTPKRPLQVT